MRYTNYCTLPDTHTQGEIHTLHYTHTQGEIHTTLPDTHTQGEIHTLHYQIHTLKVRFTEILYSPKPPTISTPTAEGYGRCGTLF